jgi:transposase
MQTDQPTSTAARRSTERRQQSKEFKAEAVRLVKEGGRSYRDVAHSLDLDIGLLRKWAKALDAQGAEAFRGHGQRTAVEQENHDLRQQIKRLREENDILKKAARYFAANLP